VEVGGKNQRAIIHRGSSQETSATLHPQRSSGCASP
jgi:hypothetical protein